MLKGIDLSQRIEFKSKTDDETVFLIRPLSGIEMIELSQHIDNGNLRLSGKYIIDLLDKVVVEIKNAVFIDKRKFIESLPPVVIMELVEESGKINGITENDRKNS